MRNELMRNSDALARFTEHRKTDFVQPPSPVILATHNKYKSIPPQAVLLETAQATLLPEDEVAIWFQHLLVGTLNLNDFKKSII